MTDIPSSLPLVIVAGPTASGKSALALAIAERFRGMVINADSMQVYRDLHVLTARPSPAEEARAPHRLYGVLDAAEHGTASVWCGLARQAIAEAAEKGLLPILCGGTGMYMRALTEGLARIPAIPADIRNEAVAALTELGTAGLHGRLAAADPETAARLKTGDSQRVLRAWEVWLATGRGLAAWQREAAEPGLPNPVCRILLRPPRGPLYARIDRRFEAMMAAGALEEARKFAERRDIPADAPVRKAHGLPELLQYLRGELPLAQAIAIAQTNTRHYAKRQTTWFRHQMQPDLVEETDLGEKENFNPEAKIFPFLMGYLLTVGYGGV
ncbi:MAG: tRNA (adenosine(37)-N6)-dimethylallyltransferase MiaA [Ferrovibrio sp.]|nr:tRNA (adenosine(37)-N6)-dimethylallyltransferase MiaA [Ferrovibrio sp.]